MINLLIVDDEPLVQIGIKSMLNWAELGIEVCGTAFNGAHALEMIEQYSPELVITDIRMPVMNGLELAKTCREAYGKVPLFIILTSYEEFQLVKEAMSCQVVDYLIKLELSADSLRESVGRALDRLKELRATQELRTGGRPLLQIYHDKFFLRLLHNLFDNEEQFDLQARDLRLDFSNSHYVASHSEIQESNTQSMSHEQLINLHGSTLQMVREIFLKHVPCHVISLDMKHFSVIFPYPRDDDQNQRLNAITEAYENVNAMARNYFNVRISTGIGSAADTPLKICDSYQDARMAFTFAGTERPIVHYDQAAPDAFKNSFNIALFKNQLTKAFEEFDTDILFHTLSEMIEVFSNHPLRYLQAIDGACNILYLAISLLPEGENTLSDIFSGVTDGYRSIYRMNKVEQVTDWMVTLRDGLCKTLKSKRATYKAHVITSVQKYIQAHVTERLSLNEVAAVFGLSSNYLSLLFKKTCNIGFSEYIAQLKVSKAKVMLIEQDLKIYEAADRLGFESAFYFSKVFKKIEGISPREYIQQKEVPYV